MLAARTRAEIEHTRRRYPHPRSAIMPSLWAVQHELGWLPPEAMAEVAELLGLAPSEVQAVATFYSMYFKRPPGRHHILVCVNAACALRGADETAAHIEQRLGCPSGTTTADGMFTWESTIECLGGCGGAPMMQVDHHFEEHLTPERIDAILARVAAQPADHRDWPPARVPNPPASTTPPPPTAEGPPSAGAAG
ncbi:MAG: NADH-quinone oxidoreductase subunit [Chloroflexi bacterium]|jgi:NADH-quinone oxidoreductase subunit E|nr:NADH-quinone oxidoreductase subunit [Chloroflexota bacterium]MEA2615078.1 NADH-quinone oxidoreductase subunit [Chloroflexota bacterium]